MNGKTVEALSTDAEGRLILADALTYTVRNLAAPRVLDVATLTGACGIALGRAATGAMTYYPELLGLLRRAADSAGERVWEMPLFDDYREQIKSDIADLKKSGGTMAGTCTAGMFLRQFIDEKHWVHLDIAATARTAEPPAHLANAVMLRTLVHMAESLAEGKPRA